MNICDTFLANGELTITELRSGLVGTQYENFGYWLTDHRMGAFLDADKDGSGTVNQAELEGCLREYYQRGFNKSPPGVVYASPPKRSPSPSVASYNDEAIRRLEHDKEMLRHHLKESQDELAEMRAICERHTDTIVSLNDRIAQMELEMHVHRSQELNSQVAQLGEELRAERSTTQILQGQLKDSQSKILRLQTDLTFAREHSMSDSEVLVVPRRADPNLSVSTAHPNSHWMPNPKPLIGCPILNRRCQVAAFKRDCEEAAMEAAMEAARGDIERSRKTRDEALTAADQLAAKLRKFETQKEDHGANNDSMKKEMAAMYEDMQVLVEQRDALRQKLTDNETLAKKAKANDRSAAELASAKEEIARLQTQLRKESTDTSALADCKKKINELSETLEHATREGARKDAKARDLQEALAGAQDKTRELERQIASQKAEKERQAQEAAREAKAKQERAAKDKAKTRSTPEPASQPQSL